MSLVIEKFATAERRWAGIGPYYAMFPTTFAEHVIRKYTDVGDIVLDPFAGRGTAVFAAAMHERHGFGIEINPVGWVYAKAKLQTASKADVSARIKELAELAPRYQKAAEKMPLFFRHCFCDSVLQFLLAARAKLAWKLTKVDWTLMALLLVHLHGKRTDSFSNQMRQTKAMSPQYAIEWWKDHKQKAPRLDPVTFMDQKLQWRFAKGIPNLSSSHIYLGDSVNRLSTVATALSANADGVKLLFTSPPYCGVTNYHYDQWIRLWLLGGRDTPKNPFGKHRGKFVDREKYKGLLENVFTKAKALLADDAVVYVRTDHRPLTLDITVDVLKALFPDKQMRKYQRPRSRKSQTWLFTAQPGKPKKRFSEKGDVDIVLLP